jgi:hypothetical protein
MLNEKQIKGAHTLYIVLACKVTFFVLYYFSRQVSFAVIWQTNENYDKREKT